jgi:hypothetical protein
VKDYGIGTGEEETSNDKSETNTNNTNTNTTTSTYLTFILHFILFIGFNHADSRSTLK